MGSLHYPGFIMEAVVASAFLVAGCASDKETLPASFDMAEYRNVMDRQKQAQSSFGEGEQPVAEMTADDHEKAGDTYAQQRNYMLANIHYSKALKADLGRNSVRLRLGQLFLQQGLFDAALTQFQDLKARDPKSAPAHQGIGHVYLMQSKLSEAEQALQKAVALDPSNWVSHNLLGLTYDHEQRYGEAVTAYKAALALRPRDQAILNNLGLAYALSGDHEAAIQSFEQAVATGNASPKIHNNLGLAYARRERYIEAFESFRKATDEPRAYNNLGVALMGMRKPKQAAACFEKAVESNPQFYENASENLRQARQAIEKEAATNSTTETTDSASCL